MALIIFFPDWFVCWVGVCLNSVNHQANVQEWARTNFIPTSPTSPTSQRRHAANPLTQIVTSTSLKSVRQDANLCHQSHPPDLLSCALISNGCQADRWLYGWDLFSKAQFENCGSLAYRDLRPPRGYPQMSNKPGGHPHFITGARKPLWN